MVAPGCIPVGPRNLSIFPTDGQVGCSRLVEERSGRADLVALADKGELLERHRSLGDAMFVSTNRDLTVE